MCCIVESCQTYGSVRSDEIYVPRAGDTSKDLERTVHAALAGFGRYGLYLESSRDQETVAKEVFRVGLPGSESANIARQRIDAILASRDALIIQFSRPIGSNVVRSIQVAGPPIPATDIDDDD